VLARAGIGPADGRSGRLSVSAWRNDDGGERATGTRGSG
jgi:hypothetical protein